MRASAMRWCGYASAFLLGTGLGAGLTMKILETEFDSQLDVEVEKTKRYFDRLHKRGEYSDPVALVEAKGLEIAETLVEQLEYKKPFEEHAVGTKNVFKEEIRDLDIGKEIKNRTVDRPYVITSDEYFQNSTDYAQISVNYYSEDGVLCHLNDDYIRESDDFVGDENLLRFGEGSGDPNVVYVRNDKKESEYEVIRIRGSYNEVVHGILEHSDKKRKVSKKFRNDYE